MNDPPSIDGSFVPSRSLQLSRDYMQNIAESVIDLGTFDTESALPDGTAAEVAWTPEDVVTVTPTALGNAVNDAGETVYRYRIDVPPHTVGQYYNYIPVTLKHDDERAFGQAYLFGIMPGLGVSWPREDGSTSITIAEGIAGPSGTWITDSDPVADDQYRVQLALEDGRSFVGHVETSAGNSNEKQLWIDDLPALWSKTGLPFEGFDYGDINEGGVNAFPTGVLTITRPGATLVTKTRFYANNYESNWIVPAYVDSERLGLPQMFDVSNLRPEYQFTDRRGVVDLDLTSTFAIDPSLLQVAVDWGEWGQPTTPATITQNADGSWHAHAEYLFLETGYSELRFSISYGDATRTFSADAYSDEPASTLPTVDLPESGDDEPALVGEALLDRGFAIDLGNRGDDPLAFGDRPFDLSSPQDALMTDWNQEDPVWDTLV